MTHASRRARRCPVLWGAWRARRERARATREVARIFRVPVRITKGPGSRMSPIDVLFDFWHHFDPFN